MLYDLVIRNGTIVDGSGQPSFVGDLAISQGIIKEIGIVSGKGSKEIDASGLLVTPGFVDVHTHYDGQATWSTRLAPSSEHGVTTVVMGNCGVGFAPCKEEDRARMIGLMEGVEDIPNPVLSEGLHWNWESFSDYLDALDDIPHDIDFGCQLPHGALRVFVMGEAGAQRDAATADEITRMADIAAEAMRAGALGFSTSRTLNHRTSDGDPTPSYAAAEQELVGISMGLKAAGSGVLQVASDFSSPALEMQTFHNMVEQSGRPLIFSLAQTSVSPNGWRDMLAWVESENANGTEITAMVCGRPVGILLGLDTTLNPFSLNQAYQEIAHLPIPDRIQKMRDPVVREAILNGELNPSNDAFRAVTSNYDYMFQLGALPNYEQPKEKTLAEMARAKGCSPQELAYDILLQHEGKAMLYTTFLNYADYSLEPSLEMMRHPNTVLGLADGGAHVGMICDGSFPTSMLTHWTRDRVRGERLSIEWVIRSQCMETARAYGLNDRGVLAPGYKADVNIINYDELALHHPYMVHDLPAGGKRLAQDAVGYVATIVSGVVIQEHGKPTGALPGKLVRGPQHAPGEVMAAQ